MSTVAAPAKRGEIFDRNGRLLAYSVDADTIYAVPTEIADAGEDRGGAVRRARRLHQEVARGAARSAVAAALVRVRAPARLADAGQARRRARARRHRRSARRASATTRIASWPRTCSATSASTTSAWAASRRPTTRRCAGARASCWCRPTRAATCSAGSSDRRPPAASIELTIDQHLQHIAEREVRAGVEAARADGGTAVIMDPHSGEILAMASWPTFNPNEYSDAPENARRNRAVQDLYEPGSTFKLVTASAAIEEKVVTPDEIIDVSAGNIRFGSRVIDDMHRNGLLTFTDVIVKSSNVGAIKVGLKLGAERMGLYIRRFGFGRPIVAGLSRREPRHRVGAVEAERQRAGVGVDGLPGRRDAAADGRGGERDRQRRHALRTARGPRDRQGRACAPWSLPKAVRRAILPETAATLTDDHGEGRDRRHRERRASWSATTSPARPAPPTSSSTAATRRRSRTSRSSASCRRAVRR